MQDPFFKKALTKRILRVLLSSILHSSLDLTVGVVLGDRVALVVELFASAKADLYLDTRA